MVRIPVSFQSIGAAFPQAARRIVILIALSIATALPLRADITIKFDDLKDGDKISDVAAVIVRADSGEGIDKVEFAVDDQLRFSSGSTPYTFKWDTIADTEGSHNLAVTATDANGAKKTVKMTLTVDNQLSLGAAALAQRAREALLARDMDTANKFSRRALKADPENVEAARAMAAIQAERLSWDRAIATLQKNKNLSGSVPAMLELAGYHMHRAVLPENTANLVSDIESAAQLRRKAADSAVEAIKAKNLPADQAQSHEMLGDAYLNAARYAEAIQEYSKSASTGALTSVNRLALAYVLNEQAQEAIVLLRQSFKDKTGDAATRAVQGLALLRLRRFAEAKEAVRSDLGGNSPASLVVAAYADAVLGKSAAALQEAKDAVAARPMAGEAHYALSMSLPRLIDSEAEIVRALALSPFQSGPMIDFAARYALAADHPAPYETALKLLQAVLKTEPNNRNAQLAQVLLLFQMNRIAEAEPLLAELNKRDPQAADVQIAAAMYFDIKGNPTAVEERMKLARKLEPDFFDTELGVVPKPRAFLLTAVRRVHYRGGFYLSPETLYPPKAATTAATGSTGSTGSVGNVF